MTVSFDSFKGCIDGYTASRYVARALRRDTGADAAALPLADGGEGTAASLRSLLGGRSITIDTEDAYGNAVRANAVLLPGDVAAMDMASCCGLGNDEGTTRARVMEASSYGVGLMLRRLTLLYSPRRILLGMGGSASCDGGMGMLQALGARITFEGKAPRRAAGRDLGAVKGVEMPLSAATAPLTLLRDVSAPLCGERGAALRYAPQKGATDRQAAMLERGMRQWCTAVARASGRNAAVLAQEAGMGAAGGVSLAGLLLRAVPENGAGYITGLIAPMLRGTDIVITGEGRTDGTSLQGKAPVALMRKAKALGLKVMLISGAVTIADEILRKEGFDWVTAVSPPHPSARDLDRKITAQRLIYAASAKLSSLQER